MRTSMLRTRLILSIAAALAASNNESNAQANLSSPGPLPLPLRHHAVLSISGGISKGSYQAGVNWALLQLYRGATDDSLLKLPRISLASIAGASAGNINTVLWAIEACTRDQALRPEESLFWKMWVSVGMSHLLPEKLRPEDSERALFHRGFFRDSLYGLIEQSLGSPALVRPCTIRSGVTLTRIRPDTLTIGSLAVPTQRFATVFNARVHEDDSGRRRLRFEWPAEDSLLVANRRFGKLVLPPRDSNGRVLDSTIFAIAEASAAFPIAFQPKFLEVYHPDKGRTLRDWYVDGGVFDNNPVGLGLELFTHAFAPLLSDSIADTVTVVYVNPGRLRRPLDSLRAEREQGLASGGINSALQLLGGAVETARQYELQLWMRDPGVGHPDTLAMKLTSRSHPIFGDHLGSFAAFLARPFREYDFYVGIYDALHFVVQEYACAGEDQAECIPRKLGSTISDPPVVFGSTASRLLSKLFEREYGLGVDSTQLARVLASVPAAISAEDSAREAVLLSLHDAQEVQYSANKPVCGNVPVPQAVLCRDNFLPMLQRFQRSPGVREQTAKWLRQCRSGGSRASCEEAADLVRLVDDPIKYTSRKTDAILRRLREVEHELHLEARRGGFVDSRGRTRGKRNDAELLATIVQSTYRSQPLRPRYGFELSGTSAPARWVNALPYHLGGGLGNAGWEVGYRPMVNLNARFALTVPLTAHWRPKRVESEEGRSELDFYNYLGAGVGLAVRGLWPVQVSALFPEFGVAAHVFNPITDGVEGRFLVGEVYTDFSLAVGRLRVAVRGTTTEDRMFNGGNFGGFAGVSDANGWLYWVGSVFKDMVAK